MAHLVLQANRQQSSALEAKRFVGDEGGLSRQRDLGRRGINRPAAETRLFADQPLGFVAFLRLVVGSVFESQLQHGTRRLDRGLLDFKSAQEEIAVRVPAGSALRQAGVAQDLDPHAGDAGQGGLRLDHVRVGAGILAAGEDRLVLQEFKGSAAL